MKEYKLQLPIFQRGAFLRERRGGGERERDSDFYYTKIEILGDSLFLQSVLAKLL